MNDTIPCGNITCAEGFEPAPLGDGCCACEATMMQVDCGEVQDDYDAAKEAILEDLGNPGCTTDEDCVGPALVNECRAQCSVPLHREIAEKFQSRVSEWAAEHCAGCPVGDINCAETTPHCFEGKCNVEVVNP